MPYGADQTVYLVVDRFERLGSAYRETEVERTDLSQTVSPSYDNAAQILNFLNRFHMLNFDSCHLPLSLLRGGNETI